MKYKALLCDVDGTLVPNQREGMPSQKVIEAIKKANNIIPVVIATARSYWQVAHILDVLELSCPSILTSGSQIINPKTRKTFLEHSLAKQDIFSVAKIARDLNITLTVANRDGEYNFSKNSLPKKPIDMYTNALSLEKADAFIQKLSHIPSIACHKALGWGKISSAHVIITHPKVSKQDGILEVAKILGIQTHEIIGIGEGYNDFPFLMACGFKIAMGNAIEDVKQIADHIVGSVEEDGVAEAIEKFVLK